MLVIREAQMRMFGAALRSRFLLRLSEHLRQRFPQRRFEELHQLASNSVAEARGLGFSTEEDLTRFAEYVALFGSPLSAVSTPHWIPDTLRRTDLSPIRKLDALDDHYTFGRARE